MDRFDFIEQKTLLLDNENIRDEKRIAHLKELCLDFETRKDEIKYLGLNPFDYTVSYYIGIDWLKENESYIVVHPKIEKLDYVQMFVHCLHHPEISKFLKDVYHVDFQKPLIEIPSSDWDLTPFLVVHFLSLVENIVKQGLKSNYIIHEENLNSKIKGKIAFSQQIKKNIVTKREDRVFCRFQEYSTNCFENRLLKKALLFIQKYTARHLDRAKYKTLFQKQNCLIAAFETVSDDISYSETKRIKINALYKEYVEAIELAKKILRHFGHSYKKAETANEKKLPPFWIDMSKLFELYVYSLLKEEYGKDIMYQLSESGKRQTHGYYGDIDFMKIDEKLLIDTKYKLVYTEDDKYDIENIRQLSGYARDRKVREKLKIDSDNEVIDCLIIYPNANATVDFKERDLKKNKIKQFVKFYKCGIRLPVK